jgi:hypothetical protein
MKDDEFPPAHLLGWSIFDDRRIPSALGELLVPLIRRFPDVKPHPLLRPVPIGHRLSGNQATHAQRPILDLGPRVDLEEIYFFADRILRFEETIHLFFLQGRLRVRGCPADQAGDYVVISKFQWFELRPTLRFLPLRNLASGGRFVFPMIDAIGPTCEYHFLKLLPHDWTGAPRAGFKEAEAWMRANLTSPESKKRDDAIKECREKTGCSYEEAQKAWQGRPETVRRKRGRPRKIKAANLE